MSTILALDQASRISGWSVFVDEKLEAYGKIEAADDDITKRLVYIRKEVKNLLDMYNPDFVIMEDIQLQNNVMNNVKTFKVLSEVFGIIDELLEEEEYPHDAVLAGTWKSTLKIKGKNRAEQKKNAQQFVLDTYGIKATQDECDSICIGTHYQLKTENPPSTGFDWS